MSRCGRRNFSSFWGITRSSLIDYLKSFEFQGFQGREAPHVSFHLLDRSSFIKFYLSSFSNIVLTFLDRSCNALVMKLATTQFGDFNNALAMILSFRNN